MNKRQQNKQEKAEINNDSTTVFNSPDKRVLYIMGLIDELDGHGVLHQHKRQAKLKLRWCLNSLVYTTEKYPEVYNKVDNK